MNPSNLLKRTFNIAKSTILFSRSILDSPEIWSTKSQLLRCSSSVAANYRAACRARSDREFYSKLCIVVEEADETLFWLELIKETQKFDKVMFDDLYSECSQILKIMSRSKSTSGARLKK